MRKIVMVTTATLVLAAAALAVAHDGGFRRIRELLTGLKEVPVVSSPARALFTATINKDQTEIEYELTYSGFETDVQQAHIHVGRPDGTGGIVLWLCSNLASPPTPAGVQKCPVREGTITGLLTEANVVAATAQGIAPGELDEVMRMLTLGFTYVNIHTTQSPGGEIRSQIDNNDGMGHDHDH
jgi:hypothetical protein